TPRAPRSALFPYTTLFRSGVEERRGDDVADLDGAAVGADGLDDADELVAHAAAGLVVRHRLVRPEVAAADGGAGDGDEGVGRLRSEEHTSELQSLRHLVCR